MNVFLTVPLTCSLMLEKLLYLWNITIYTPGQNPQYRLLVSCGLARCAYCIWRIMDIIHCHIMPTAEKNRNALTTANQVRGNALIKCSSPTWKWEKKKKNSQCSIISKSFLRSITLSQILKHCSSDGKFTW